MVQRVDKEQILLSGKGLDENGLDMMMMMMMMVMMMMMMIEVGFDYFDYGDVADLHAGCDDNNDHNDE